MHDLQTMARSDRNGVSVSGGRPLSQGLVELLVRRPDSTSLFQVSGHHYADQGVCDGDIAVVDQAQARSPGDLVIRWSVDGFGICRQRDLDHPGDAVGVVTAVIHRLQTL